MLRVAERNERTPELLVSGSQIHFTAMALLTTASMVKIVFERLLFRQWNRHTGNQAK